MRTFALAAVLALQAMPALAAPDLVLNIKGEPSIRVVDRKATLLPKMSEWRIRKLLGAPQKWYFYGDDHVVRRFDYRTYGLRVTFHKQTVMRYEVYLRPEEVEAYYAGKDAGFVYQGIDMKAHLEGYQPASARFDVPISAGMSPADVIKALGDRPHRQSTLRPGGESVHRYRDGRVVYQHDHHQGDTLYYRFDQGRGDLVFGFVDGHLCEVSVSR